MLENNNEANLNLLKIIYDNRKLFIVVAILAVLTAVLVTILTPKRFKSSGTVFPVNSNAYNDIIENPAFGTENDADKLIQLFESNYVKDRIIKEFDLAKVWEVDTTDPAAQYYLYLNYDSDITFSRTRYLSVKIQAITKDPELSKNIVNRLIEIIDNEREKILKTNVQLIVNNYQKEYDLKRSKVNKLLDSIYFLADNGVKNKSNPLFKYREMFMEERQKNTHIYPGDEAVKKISNINQTQEVERLINEYYFMQGRLNFVRSKLDEANIRLNMPIASVYKISWAKANYQKVSPRLSINGIVFVGAGFILTLLLLLAQDQLKRIKQEI